MTRVIATISQIVVAASIVQLDVTAVISQSLVTAEVARVVLPADALCPEYEDVYDSYLAKPTDADAWVDNTMIEGWVDDEVWAKIDGIWILANHAAGADSLRNWITPANTATVYNAPAWVQWEGYTGNGSNAYIDLG